MSVCAVTRVVLRRENAWPTALPAAFVWREVASPTAFEKKKTKKKKIILKTTRYKVNFICDQQQEKEQGN